MYGTAGSVKIPVAPLRSPVVIPIIGDNFDSSLVGIENALPKVHVPNR